MSLEEIIQFSLTDICEMVSYVCCKNHFSHSPSHVPILGLTQKLKNIILRIKQELECNCAMMVL